MDSAHKQEKWENSAVARAQLAAKAENAPTRGWRCTDTDCQLLVDTDTELRLFSTKARFHESRSKKPVQPHGLFY